MRLFDAHLNFSTCGVMATAHCQAARYTCLCYGNAAAPLTAGFLLGLPFAVLGFSFWVGLAIFLPVAEQSERGERVATDCF